MTTSESNLSLGPDELTVRNELWEHDADDRSLESFGPPDKSKLAFDSRPPSSYGDHEYQSPHFNKPLSHVGSFSELPHSSYQIPHLGYEPSLAYSPSRPESLHGVRDSISMPIGPTLGAEHQSVYSLDLRHPVNHRQPEPDALWAQSRAQSHYTQDRHVSLTDLEATVVKQTTSLLDPTQRGGYHEHGAGLISSASLHNSIARICDEADLENLTKRNVRQRLEQEYGVDLGSRKDEISRIVEAVIEHDVSPMHFAGIDK